MSANILRFDSEHCTADSSPTVAFHLLGLVGFDTTMELRHRLADEPAPLGTRRITVLLCEHPPIITVGRRGSRRHLRFSHDDLERRQLPVRWVSRSGGCWLHSPGQLALYVMQPNEEPRTYAPANKDWLNTAIADTLCECGVSTERSETLGGHWGRTGAIALTAASERRGMLYDEAVINVNPPMHDFAFVDSIDPDSSPVGTKTTMGSMLGETRQPTKMTAIRSTLMSQLAAQLGCERYHIYTGHPWLRNNVRAAA